MATAQAVERVRAAGAVLALSLLAGCGGGKDDPSTWATASEEAARMRESSLAAASLTCTADADCGELRFEGACGSYGSPVSLLSPNLALAQSLAAEQRRLVQLASRLPDAPPPTPCLPPAPEGRIACVQSACTRTLPR